MSSEYIYLVTDNSGTPIDAFTKKYACTNFILTRGFTDNDVKLYSIREGLGNVRESKIKKVDVKFFLPGMKRSI